MCMCSGERKQEEGSRSAENGREKERQRMKRMRRTEGSVKNLRRFHAWRSVERASFVSRLARRQACCSHGRQLPVGLPPPRIISDQMREKKREKEGRVGIERVAVETSKTEF